MNHFIEILFNHWFSMVNKIRVLWDNLKYIIESMVWRWTIILYSWILEVNKTLIRNGWWLFGIFGLCWNTKWGNIELFCQMLLGMKEFWRTIFNFQLLENKQILLTSLVLSGNIGKHLLNMGELARYLQNNVYSFSSNFTHFIPWRTQSSVYELGYRK